MDLTHWSQESAAILVWIQYLRNGLRACLVQASTQGSQRDQIGKHKMQNHHLYRQDRIQDRPMIQRLLRQLW